MKGIATTLWLLSVSSLVFSQGAFLDKDVSGVEIGAALSGQQDKSYAGQVQFGYSFLGFLDAGLALGPGKTNQDKVGLSAGQRYLSFSPSLALYALKQDAHMPLSLALSASYEADSYYSDYLSQNNMALGGSTYSLGASVYRNFPISKGVKLVANVGLKYRMERDVLESDDGIMATSYNDYPKVTVGCDALFKQFNNNLLRVGAGIGYDQSNNQNNVTISAVVSVVVPRVARIFGYNPRRYIVVPAGMIEHPRTGVTQPASPEPDTIVINVPGSKGGFVPIRLLKTRDGYIGPQGELYPNRPTVEQLEALYGD
jgi:hypothetical protein